MFFLLIPAAYAAYRLGKAAVNAPVNQGPEAVGKEVVSLAVDAASVVAVAGWYAVEGVVGVVKTVATNSGSSDDGSRMSAGERFVETSGGLEGEGSGFDPGGF